MSPSIFIRENRFNYPLQKPLESWKAQMKFWMKELNCLGKLIKRARCGSKHFYSRERKICEELNHIASELIPALENIGKTYLTQLEELAKPAQKELPNKLMYYINLIKKIEKFRKAHQDLRLIILEKLLDIYTTTIY